MATLERRGGDGREGGCEEGCPDQPASKGKGKQMLAGSFEISAAATKASPTVTSTATWTAQSACAKTLRAILSTCVGGKFGDDLSRGGTQTKLAHAYTHPHGKVGRVLWL